MDYRVNIYPHNDLLNLAWYHVDVIRKKLDSGTPEGISLDAMSAIIAMAFSVEALINFVGFKSVEGWVERDHFKKKVKAIDASLNIRFDWQAEPFKTLRQLKELRDHMAHGKPIELTKNRGSPGSMAELLGTPWDSFLTPAYVQEAYSQVVAFEEMLLKSARIQVEQALTNGWTTETEVQGNITVRRRQSWRGVRADKPLRKPPRSILTNAVLIEKMTGAFDELIKAVNKPPPGPPPRIRFPKPRSR